MAKKGRTRAMPWPPAGNGMIDKCIKDWRDKGYDVTHNPPYGKDYPCRILPIQKLLEAGDKHNDVGYATQRIHFILGKINAQARNHGEEYEFKEIVKVASCMRGGWFGISTFNAREVNTGIVNTVEALLYEEFEEDESELRDWRFKPGPPQVPFIVTNVPPGFRVDFDLIAEYEALIGRKVICKSDQSSKFWNSSDSDSDSGFDSNSCY